MSPVKVIVAGAGHLGRYHAQKAAKLSETELVGILDLDSQKAQALAGEMGVPEINDFQNVEAEAVVVSTTTSAHAEVATAAMRAGLHVLVEKPIASSVVQAQAIIDCAQANSRVLAVGHSERFNPAVASALKVSHRPRISRRRLSPFSGRSLDVDVILDLMIHDLDILSSMVMSPLKEVSCGRAGAHQFHRYGFGAP